MRSMFNMCGIGRFDYIDCNFKKKTVANLCKNDESYVIDARGYTNKSNETIVRDRDLFCGNCSWIDKSLSCNQRVLYLIEIYKLDRHAATAAAMKDNSCRKSKLVSG